MREFVSEFCLKFRHFCGLLVLLGLFAIEMLSLVLLFRQTIQSDTPSSSSLASAAAAAATPSSTLSTSLATQSRNAILVSHRQVSIELWHLMTLV